jgi:iron-sulfur cluster repair protein YtfE (RIC family)
MQSPARGVRFIHLAILRELADLEAAAWTGALEGFAERAERLRRLVELHTKGEEAGSFADLAVRVPESVATYLLDHVEEQESFHLMIAAAHAGDVKSVQQLVTALAAHTRAHVRKEEDLLIPLIERTFTMPEIGAQVGRMMGVFPPAELLAALPWIVARLELPEGVAYCQLLTRVMPTERLPLVAGALRGGLPDATWGHIAAAVPALA